MFCMNCGKKIDDNGKFCPFCGSAIGGTGQSNGQAQMLNVKKSLISKNAIIGMAAGVIAVLLVIIVVISGGKKETTSASLVEVKEDTSTTSDSVKEASDEQSVVYAEEEKNNNEMTLPEKLFEMPIEDYASMTRASFKEMLDEEGVLYTQDDHLVDDTIAIPIDIDSLEIDLSKIEGEIKTSVSDSFMGYDCSYTYGYNTFGAKPTSLASKVNALNIFLAFDTQEDFKVFKEDLEEDLDKSLVDGKTVIKAESENFDFPEYIYLVECSDKGAGDFFNEPACMEKWKSTLLDYYFAEAHNSDVEDLLSKCMEYLKSGEEVNQQLMENILEECDYRVYKFIQVSYPLDVDIDTVHSIVPSDKQYTDCMCQIQVICVPMTDEQYDSYVEKWQ